MSRLPRAGLFLRLVVAQVSVLTLVVGSLGFYFPSRQIADAEDSLNRKATTYSHLVAQEVRSCVAFDDRETAREVFDALAADEDFEAAALYYSDGRLLHSRGRLSGSALMAPGNISVSNRSVAVSTKVTSLEGPTGVLVVELNRGTVERTRERVTRSAIVAAVAALLLGVLGAWLVARALTRRLDRIAQAASRIAAGDLDQPPVGDAQSDEVGVLARAFDTMVGRVRSLLDHIKQQAAAEQERLEGLVNARTTELMTRTAEMSRILTHAEQGFVVVSPIGEMAPERSAILADWWGAASADASFFDYLGAVDRSTAAWLRLGWESLTDGFLPLDVCLAQLPARATAGSRHYALEYIPVGRVEDHFDAILVVVSDVTERDRLEAAELEQKEVLELFRRVCSDRSGFLEFLEETERLVRGIADHTHRPRLASEQPAPDFARFVHTLKGNCAIYGAQTLVRLCHAIEEESASGNSTTQLVSDLEARWRELSTELAEFVGEGQSTLEITDAQLIEMLSRIDAGASLGAIREQLASWRMRPARRRLERIAEQAQRLAQRLNKGPLDVHVEDGGVLLEPTALAEFWTEAVHAVRNAVDHGLETQEERRGLGKCAEGRITLRANVTPHHLEIEIEDDGRGIDWERLRTVALSRNMPCGNERELVEVLFADGTTTRDVADETSGRGIGMGALRAACEALSGRIDVVSEPGAGLA